MNHYL